MQPQSVSAAAVEQSTAPRRPRRGAGRYAAAIRSPYLSAGTAIVVLGVLLTIRSPYFLTFSNGIAIGYLVSIVALLAIGETIVLISGGVDLSAGALLGLSGLISADALTKDHLPAIVAVFICLAVGAVGGAINGAAIAYLGVTPFIVTLASGSIAAGITLVISQGVTVTIAPSSALAWLGGTDIGRYPLLFSVIIVLFVLFEFGLRRTTAGRGLYALGGNARAAELAGIPRKRTLLGVYTIAGLLYGVAGLAQIGILDAATSSAGSDDLLTPIAAAVIGGVSLFGGEGSVLGAGLGIIVIGLISDGLNLTNVSAFYTQIVFGVVVFVAVLGDSARRAVERRRL